MSGPRNALEIGTQRFYRCPAHPGDKYVSVTTALKYTYQWGLPAGSAAKVTAERAFDRADEWLEMDRDAALKFLKAGHVERRDRAANDGTLCHLAAERIISGVDWREPDGDYALPERLFPVARRMEDWFRARHYETVLVERTVYNHLLQYAGTIDGLVRDAATGELYILDLKTGFRDPAKWRLQLAAYANADHWVDDEDNLSPLPTIAGAIVLWIPREKPDKWLPIKLDVGMETRAVFLSVLHSYRFLSGTREDDGELDTAWAMGGVA